MTNLTVFTTCKSFDDRSVAIAQTNALESWTLLTPRPEIIVYGRDPGTSSTVGLLELRYKPGGARDGPPRLDELFELAERDASHDILCYINADIVMLRGLAELALLLDQTELLGGRPFVASGRRWDVPALLDQAIPFHEDGWRQKLASLVDLSGSLHECIGAADWFMFRRGTYPQIPPFIVGRTAWDNWLLLDPVRRGLMCVDATKTVVAIHQAESELVMDADFERNQELWRACYPLAPGEGTLDAFQARCDVCDDVQLSEPATEFMLTINR